MVIKIRKAIGEAVGFAKWTPFGIPKERWGWHSHTDTLDLDLAKLSKKQLDGLVALITSKEEQERGITVLLRDIAKWQAAINDPSKARPRTVQQFNGLLINFMLSVKDHWLFEKSGEDGNWLPYYVNRVTYHPESKARGDYTPASVEMQLIYEQFGGQKSFSESFMEGDLRGMGIAEALARKGYYPSTQELVDRHLADISRFSDLMAKTGQQFLCTGKAFDDCDGNKEGRQNSWYWRKVHTLDMLRNGEPSRTVIDLFYEDGDEKDDRDAHPDQWFWTNAAKGRASDDDSDDVSFDDTDLEDAQVEIPIHPYLVVFDLAKHLRVRVHVTQLTEYVYDPDLADKLVLPPDTKALVKLLIEAKDAGFKDIVKGKSGGAVVLLAGPPGTGKTLTAEVYAEAEGRALYSVQCSQLGTNPDELEDELLKVFSRAKRWNAVMLLDEADVYVHERGNDLQQNAIVGVFLRVLEYQDTVLFLTTNRPEDVDDAIASRCIARLTYAIPTEAQQKQIWRVLSTGAGAKITDQAIDQIVDRNRHLSGRDVKNLLKLARVMSDDGVTPDAVEFVKQFKPTGNQAVQVPPAGISRCPDCGKLMGKKQHVCSKAPAAVAV